MSMHEILPIQWVTTHTNQIVKGIKEFTDTIIFNDIIFQKPIKGLNTVILNALEMSDNSQQNRTGSINTSYFSNTNAQKQITLYNPNYTYDIFVTIKLSSISSDQAINFRISLQTYDNSINAYTSNIKTLPVPSFTNGNFDLRVIASVPISVIQFTRPLKPVLYIDPVDTLCTYKFTEAKITIIQII